jgi:hypothetical protein
MAEREIRVSSILGKSQVYLTLRKYTSHGPKYTCAVVLLHAFPTSKYTRNAFSKYTQFLLHFALPRPAAAGLTDSRRALACTDAPSRHSPLHCRIDSRTPETPCRVGMNKAFCKVERLALFFLGPLFDATTEPPRSCGRGRASAQPHKYDIFTELRLNATGSTRGMACSVLICANSIGRKFFRTAVAVWWP